MKNTCEDMYKQNSIEPLLHYYFRLKCLESEDISSSNVLELKPVRKLFTNLHILRRCQQNSIYYYFGIASFYIEKFQNHDFDI